MSKQTGSSLTPEERKAVAYAVGHAMSYGITIVSKSTQQTAEKDSDQIKGEVPCWAPRIHTIVKQENESADGVYTVFFTNTENKTLTFTSLEILKIVNQDDEKPYKTKEGMEVFFDAEKAFKLCKRRNNGQRDRLMAIATSIAEIGGPKGSIKAINDSIDTMYTFMFGGELS